MTYFGGVNTGARLPGLRDHPAAGRHRAIQRLYGANLATRTGDTVYGFNSNADRPVVRDHGEGPAGHLRGLGRRAGATPSTSPATATTRSSTCARASSPTSAAASATSPSPRASTSRTPSAGPAPTPQRQCAGQCAVRRRGRRHDHGGGGRRHVSQTSGTSYLRGEDGDDSIVGGSGFDDINGNMGNDTCVSGGGDDWVVGGKDNDSLVGSAGANLVYGNLGNDTLDGGGGADIVRGGQQDDSLSGGSGDDFLSGDRGNDTIVGGAGADIFHSFAGADLDRVLDFNFTEGDRVRLDPGTTWRVSQSGADTVIDFDGGGQMILVGTDTASLSADWIGTF
jgi:serralysin